MVRRSAYYLAAAALLLALAAGLASATASVIIHMSPPPALGAPTSKVTPSNGSILVAVEDIDDRPPKPTG